MPTFSQLPSGRWRVQVRRGGAYKAATFDNKHDAEDWAREVESQAKLVAVKGFALSPAESTPAGKYQTLHARQPRKASWQRSRGSRPTPWAKRLGSSQRPPLRRPPPG